MKIICKVLNGEETELQVRENMKVIDLKKMIQNRLGIAIEEQRLMLKGKSLSDSMSLGDYNVTEDSKIHVFLKKIRQDTNSSYRAEYKQVDFWEKLHPFLKAHFVDSDAEKVLEQFRKLYQNLIDCLSLDEIERIAEYQLQGEVCKMKKQKV